MNDEISLVIRVQFQASFELLAGGGIFMPEILLPTHFGIQGVRALVFYSLGKFPGTPRVPVGSCPYAMPGLVSAGSAVRPGSLWPEAAAHALCNDLNEKINKRYISTLEAVLPGLENNEIYQIRLRFVRGRIFIERGHHG